MTPSSKEELTRAGIDPAEPMSSERRIDQPGCWRVRDNLVARRRSGGMVVIAGFFNPENAHARAQWARALSNLQEPVEA